MLDEIRYDLIFLDIEFPKMDGIEIGKYIREIKKDNITQIVYVSGRKKYAMALFPVRPLDFIVKPLEDKQLERVIDIYIDIMGDEVYGNAKCPFKLEGQTLHAMTIGFIHPSTNQYVEYEAPLPEYFERLLQILRSK